MLGVWSLVEGRAPRKGRVRQQVGSFFCTHSTCWLQVFVKHLDIWARKKFSLDCRVCYGRRAGHSRSSQCPGHEGLLSHVRREHKKKKSAKIFRN